MINKITKSRINDDFFINYINQLIALNKAIIRSFKTQIKCEECTASPQKLARVKKSTEQKIQNIQTASNKLQNLLNIYIQIRDTDAKDNLSLQTLKNTCKKLCVDCKVFFPNLTPATTGSFNRPLHKNSEDQFEKFLQDRIKINKVSIRKYREEEKFEKQATAKQNNSENAIDRLKRVKARIQIQIDRIEESLQRIDIILANYQRLMFLKSLSRNLKSNYDLLIKQKDYLEQDIKKLCEEVKIFPPELDLDYLKANPNTFIYCHKKSDNTLEKLCSFICNPKKENDLTYQLDKSASLNENITIFKKLVKLAKGEFEQEKNIHDYEKPHSNIMKAFHFALQLDAQYNLSGAGKGYDRNDFEVVLKEIDNFLITYPGDQDYIKKTLKRVADAVIDRRITGINIRDIITRCWKLAEKNNSRPKKHEVALNIELNKINQGGCIPGIAIRIILPYIVYLKDELKKMRNDVQNSIQRMVS